METEIYVMTYTMQKFYKDETPLHTHVCSSFKEDVKRFLPVEIEVSNISYDEDLFVTKFLHQTFSSSQSSTIESLVKGGLSFDIGYYTIGCESKYNTINDLKWLEDTFTNMQSQHELVASYFLILNGTDFNSFKHIKSSQTNEKEDLFEDAQRNFDEYSIFFATYLRNRKIKDEGYYYAAKLLLACDQ